MATEIGSIYASLTAQTASFSSDLRRANRSIDTFTRSASAGLTGLNRATGLVTRGFGLLGVGIGVGAAVSFVKNVVNTVGGLEELSQQLGVTTDQLQVYRFAASQSGVSAGELEAGILRLGRTIGDAGEGNKQAIATFEKLGVKILDANKKIRPTGDIMTDVAEALSRIEDPAARAAIEVDLFGRAGQRLDPMLRDGAAGLREFEQRAKSLGLVIDQDTIKKFDEASDQVSAAWQVVVGFAAVLIADALPKIIKFGGEVVEIFNDIKAAIDAIDRFIDINVKVTGAAEGLAQLREMFGVAGESGPDAQWFDNKAGTGAGLSVDRMAELIQQEIDANNAFLEAQRAAAGAGVSGRYGRAKYKTSPGHQRYLDHVRRFVREEHLSGGPMTPTGPVIDITDGTLIDGRITGEGERHLGTPGGGTVGDSNPDPLDLGGGAKIDRAAEMVRDLQFQLEQMARSGLAQEIARNLEQVGAAADSAVGQEIIDRTTALYQAEQARADAIRGAATDLDAFLIAQQRELELLGLTDKEREVEEATLRASAAALADYQAGLRENAELQEGEVARIHAITEAQLAQVAANEAAADALEAQKQAQEDAAEAAKEHAQEVRELGLSFGRDLAGGLAAAITGAATFEEVMLHMLDRVGNEILDLIFSTQDAAGGGGGIGGIFEELLGGLFGGLFGGDSGGGMGDDVLSFAGGLGGSLAKNMAGLGGGGSVYNIDARGADVEAVVRLERAVDNIDRGLESRAVAAVVKTRRDGGPVRRAFDRTR